MRLGSKEAKDVLLTHWRRSKAVNAMVALERARQLQRMKGKLG